MIVGIYFNGDDDNQVKWLQHDVYGAALHIIVRTCWEHVKYANMVLYDDWGNRWDPVYEFDHRTLQVAHDLMAAAWRSRYAFAIRQHPLPIDGIRNNEIPDFVGHWLAWLRNEVESWNDGVCPRDYSASLIRFVSQILKNQNRPAGYRAEKKLAWELVNRYSDVPWERRWADAIESDYVALDD